MRRLAVRSPRSIAFASMTSSAAVSSLWRPMSARKSWRLSAAATSTGAYRSGSAVAAGVSRAFAGSYGPVFPRCYTRTWCPVFLFRDGGLFFGLRTRREVELDLPFLVQDEARAKRFAGTGPEPGDDLLRPALLEQLACDLRCERAPGD